MEQFALHNNTYGAYIATLVVFFKHTNSKSDLSLNLALLLLDYWISPVFTQLLRAAEGQNEGRGTQIQPALA